MNVEFNIKNRLLISSILPKEGDIKTITICKDIASKTDLTQTDFEDIGFKSSDGRYSWEKDIMKQIEFTEAETHVMKDALKKLDADKKMTVDLLDIHSKFNG